GDRLGDQGPTVCHALYLGAYTRRQVPGDEPISEIKARLRENGFLYSEAAEGKRAVVFSLARNAINLAVPMDAYVERVPDDAEGKARFKVCQQFRLVVDDPAAREALK